MRFEWDESKRQANIRKHGIDFLDAIQIFDGYTFSYEDNRFDYGEQRFITLGILIANVIVVIHTFIENDTIRIISARKATKYEQKRFISSLSN
ncbi:MAG: BrnT family toxin [Anaerolineae bacterium]|jgi:uncharacterized protein